MNDRDKFTVDMIYAVGRTIENRRRGDDKESDDASKLAAMVRGIAEFTYDAMNPMVDLKVKRTEDAKRFPLIGIKKHGDVGYDLPAVFPMGPNGDRASVVVYPQSRVVIPTGIFLEIPEGHWASIEARSSTSGAMLMVPKGVIDEGYRGELFAVLINVGTEPVIIKHGDRYVQLIVHKRNSANIRVVEVDELSPSERGATGFGSTGRSEIGR